MDEALAAVTLSNIKPIQQPSAPARETSKVYKKMAQALGGGNCLVLSMAIIQEIKKNKAISAGVTALIVLLLLLFLILFKIITPNPPFPESGGGGGQELALGMMEVGNDDIDFGKMGEVQDVVVENTPTPASKESIVTAEGGEDVQVKESKPEIKENKTVITPVKPTEKVVVKEKTAAEKMREKFLKNTGKSGGGVGNNEQAGDAGARSGRNRRLRQTKVT
jgi:hypothetical protein